MLRSAAISGESRPAPWTARPANNLSQWTCTIRTSEWKRVGHYPTKGEANPRDPIVPLQM